MSDQSRPGFSLQKLFHLVRDVPRKLTLRKGSSKCDGFPYKEHLPDKVLMPAKVLASKVSQVCCRWQRLCRDPKLRKVAEVDFTPGKNAPDARGMRELGVAPLYLSFRNNSRRAVAQRAQLLAVPKRVQHLVLDVNPRTMHLGLQVMSRVLGSLTSLHLHCSPSSGARYRRELLDDESVRTFWELVHCAPRLSALSFDFSEDSCMELLTRWEASGAPAPGPPRLHSLSVPLEDIRERGWESGEPFRRALLAILRTQTR